MTYIALLAAVIAATFGLVAAARGLQPRTVTAPAFAIFALMILVNVVWLSIRDAGMLRGAALALIALALVSTSFTVGVFGYTLARAFKDLFGARRDMQAVLDEYGVDDDLPL